jgi:predicted MFS family arabinose efflux permease
VTGERIWAGFEKGQPEHRRITIGLFVAGFAAWAQIFGAQATLPAISDDFGVSAPTAALTVSAATLGLAVSVLPWAFVADRIGRVRAMKISLIAATLLAFITPLAPTFETVLAARVFEGLAIGAVPGVAVAYLTEELASGRVAVAAGIYVSGNTLGGVFGRVIAGPISELFGWRAGLTAAAVAAAVMAMLFVVLIPRAHGFSGARIQPHPLHTRILFHFRDPHMLALYAQGFLLMGCFAGVYNYLGFHLEGPPYMIPATIVSLIFLAYLGGTFASRLSATLAVRFGRLRVIVFGIATMLVGLGLLLVPALPAILIGLVVFTMGALSAHPVASASTGATAQLGHAQATALYQLAWLGGTSLFGWLAGIVYERFGWTITVAMLAVLCVISGIAAVTGLRWLSDRRPNPPEPRG